MALRRFTCGLFLTLIALLPSSLNSPVAQPSPQLGLGGLGAAAGAGAAGAAGAAAGGATAAAVGAGPMAMAYMMIAALLAKGYIVGALITQAKQNMQKQIQKSYYRHSYSPYYDGYSSYQGHQKQTPSYGYYNYHYGQTK